MSEPIMPRETGATTILDETGRHVLAWAFPASKHSVLRVLSAEEGDDNGRSEPLWLRLENGDLMLGVFPRGDTYLDCEADSQLPRNAMTTDDVRGEQVFEVRRGISYLRDGKGVSVGFFRMPENDQLCVSINTEDSEYDNDKDGEPILQVLVNDATVYDRERIPPAPIVDRFMGPEGGPYQLRCTFVPQSADGRGGLERIVNVPLTVLGRTQEEATWIAEYDEAPSEQRSYPSDALRDHPDVPQWVKEWDGPFEIDFQVRFTVVGMYEGSDGPENRYAEAFWADDTNHAEEQARDSARTQSSHLIVSAVLYGECQVAA